MPIGEESHWACNAATYYDFMRQNRQVPQDIQDLFGKGTTHILGTLREHRIIYDRFARGQSNTRSTNFGAISLSYQNPLFDVFFDEECGKSKDAREKRKKRDEYLKQFKKERDVARMLASRLDVIIKTHDKIMKEPEKATRKEICRQRDFFLQLSKRIRAYEWRNYGPRYLVA